MQGSERLFAFLDNIYTLTTHARVAPVHAIVEEELGRHAHISINEGKTHVWNMGGVEPEVCAELQEVAVVADPNARVWRGAGDAQEQGVRVLGVPVSHPSYVRVQLSEIQHDHQTLLDRIPSLPDLPHEQITFFAWCLLFWQRNSRGEMLDACQQFVERARKRFLASEDAVRKALPKVQRLQRLREEAAAQPRVPTAEYGEVPPIPSEAQAEVNQLRATIEDLQRERDRLRSEVSRQRAEDSRPLEQSVIDMLSRGNRFNPLA